MIIRRIPKTHFEMSFGVLERSGKKSYVSDSYDESGSISYVCIDVANIVGTLVVSRSRSGKTITSIGTVVKPSHMKQGIARSLWETMLLEEKPSIVEMVLISDRGHTLINSIKSDKRFKNIKWRIHNTCGRSLRALSNKV